MVHGTIVPVQQTGTTIELCADQLSALSTVSHKFALRSTDQSKNTHQDRYLTTFPLWLFGSLLVRELLIQVFAMLSCSVDWSSS